MENEVNRAVFDVVEGIRLSSPQRTVTDVVVRMGVTDVRGKESDYAWTAGGGGLILTIWAEFTHVHSSGRWFYVESLDTKTRLGGGARSDIQQRRAEFRVSELRRMLDAKRPFRAVLQVNRIPIAELEKNTNARVGVRVRDDTDWHVARWDVGRNRAILVRGEANWAPSDAEVDASLLSRPMDGIFNVQLERGGAPVAPVAPPEPPPPPDPTLRFPDQAHRDAVEKAAVEHMMAFFTAQKLSPRSVESENLGYDIEVKDSSGAVVHLAEVKGTSTSAPGFFISRNERRCADREPAWCLAVVTDALTSPQHRFYAADEMESLFEFEPLVWRCDLIP
jgi:hypothetical protein